MDLPVKQHIQQLDQLTKSLADQLMEGKHTQSKKNALDSQLRAAEMALSCYRAALEIERSLKETDQA